MAADYVGVSLVTSTSHNSSTSITVPAGATFALVCFGGYDWANAGAGSSCSLAGQAGTFVANAGAAGGADELSMIFRVSGFATGSQTLTWVLNGTLYDGLQIAVLFFSGVDATPIRSSGTSLATSISIALSSIAGDMGVLFISDWNYDCSSAGTGQTVRVNTGAYNNNYIDACTEPATGTTTTLTGTGGGDHSAIGVILAAAAGAGGLSIPVAMATFGRRRRT